MNARTRTLIGLLTVALAAVLWPTSAAVAGNGSERLVAVITHFQDDGSAVPSPLPCPNGQAIQGDATFGAPPGDTWHGSSVYDFCLVPASLPSSFTFSGIETFTGTIDGCGTGTLTYTVDNGFAQLVPNPTSPNGAQSWTVVSGTGGLSDVVEGQGVGIFTIQLNLANEGFFAEAVVC